MLQQRWFDVCSSRRAAGCSSLARRLTLAGVCVAIAAAAAPSALARSSAPRPTPQPLWKAFPLNPTGAPLRTGKAPVRKGNAPVRKGNAPVRTGNAPRVVRPVPPTPKRRGAAGPTPQPVGKVTQSPSGGFHPRILFLVFGGLFTLALVALLGVALVQLPQPRRIGRAGRHAVAALLGGVALVQLPRPRRLRRAGRRAVASAKRNPFGRALTSFGRRSVPLVDPPAEGALAVGGELGREAGSPFAVQRLEGAWSARGAASVATILTACLLAVAVGLFIGYYVG